MIAKLRNLSNMGIIVIMFSAMMVAGGIAILYISSIALNASQQNEVLKKQNEDLTTLFIRFNESVVENRQRAAENTEFQRTALENIAQDQNQTEEVLPMLLQSFADVAEVRNQTDDLVNATHQLQDFVTFLRANFNETMLAETYQEYFTTEQMNQTLNNVEGLLNQLLEGLLQQPASS